MKYLLEVGAFNASLFVLYAPNYFNRICDKVFLCIMCYDVILRGYLTSIISGNKARKCFLESDFLAICSWISPLKLLYFRQVSESKGVSNNNCSSLSSKHFRILFPEILVVGYPFYG